MIINFCNEVFLTDFGTTKDLTEDDDITDRTSTLLQGTINYMSPEMMIK